MSEIKIGDEVLVKATVVEIRELKEGKTYKVAVANKYSYSNECMAEPENIIE